MPGTTPVSGSLTKELLASTLIRNEQLALEQVTAITFDKVQTRNLVTNITYNGQVQLGKLVIVTRGATSLGTKILSTTVYISNVKTDVDVYRLPLV